MRVFSTPDYVVLAAYLAVVVLLGGAFASRQKSLREYFHASGNMPWWAVGISLMATRLSPITYLATPGWIFFKDSRYALGGYLAALLFSLVTAAIWLPVWSRLRLLSIFEYLDRRYHPSVCIFGATIFIINMMFWLGNGVVTASMGFESVTGYDGRWCLLTIAILGTVYTVLGGIRAVIWTDVAQFVVFVVAYMGIAVVILVAFDWQPMAVYELASSKISENTGKPHTQLFSYEFKLSVEATVWAILFQRLFAAIKFGGQQEMVQRMHAAGSGRAMFKAMIGGASFSVLFCLIVMPVSWGFVAFYQKFPDLAEPIQHTDQVLPTFVVQQLPTIVRGLIMAGVLAALMSSFDSAINSMSNVMVNDFYRRVRKRPLDEQHLVWVAKGLTLVCGLLVLLFSLWQYAHSGATALERLGKLVNLIAPPVPMFFLLGIFSRRTNAAGVVCGAVAGILFVLTLNGFPGLMDPIFTGINWMWIAGFGLLVSCAVGYIASLLFPPPPPERLRGLTYNAPDG